MEEQNQPMNQPEQQPAPETPGGSGKNNLGVWLIVLVVVVIIAVVVWLFL